MTHENNLPHQSSQFTPEVETWWAIWSVSGAHIGIWRDEAVARSVFDAEYADGTITALRLAHHTATSPGGDFNEQRAKMAIYQHKKRGTKYTFLAYGKMQAEHWRDLREDRPSPFVDLQEVVIYQSEDDGTIWVRPREEFFDGRFEKLS